MPDKAPKEFIDWLKSKIDEKGWSMRETARQLGVSSPVVLSIITDGDAPSWDTCEAISKAFDVPTVVVMQLAGKLTETPPKVAQQTMQSKEWQRLIEGLSPDEVNEMMEMARVHRALKLKSSKGK